ncbi:hypothetical protein GCM10010331_15640 [Streptomyces xanthochromogenes]|nr:hypothetical protein GCM10010331_15640 [Streptomyces xanthochromogenes]
MVPSGGLRFRFRTPEGIDASLVAAQGGCADRSEDGQDAVAHDLPQKQTAKADGKPTVCGARFLPCGSAGGVVRGCPKAPAGRVNSGAAQAGVGVCAAVCHRARKSAGLPCRADTRRLAVYQSGMWGPLRVRAMWLMLRELEVAARTVQRSGRSATSVVRLDFEHAPQPGPPKAR